MSLKKSATKQSTQFGIDAHQDYDKTWNRIESKILGIAYPYSLDFMYMYGFDFVIYSQHNPGYNYTHMNTQLVYEEEYPLVGATEELE